jgi:hypothetical protein
VANPCLAVRLVKGHTPASCRVGRPGQDLDITYLHYGVYRTPHYSYAPVKKVYSQFSGHQESPNVSLSDDFTPPPLPIHGRVPGGRSSSGGRGREGGKRSVPYGREEDDEPVKNRLQGAVMVIGTLMPQVKRVSGIGWWGIGSQRG